ncbi:hypothetical protein LCGC14_2008710, partial [marine sediment metagenome]
MTISIEKFIEKYQLDNFKGAFQLKGEEKVEFYNDFN